MLVHRSSPVTPLTPVSTPEGENNAELSPRSTNSSFGSSESVPNNSPNRGDHNAQSYSALERLQFALERNGLFSEMVSNNETEGTKSSLALKPSRRNSESSDRNSSEDDVHFEVTKSPSKDSNAHKCVVDELLSPTASNIFQCPLCALVCNSRHDFNEHLVTHSKQYICPKCSFLTDDKEKLRDHALQAHSVSDFDSLTDEEVRTPKTNSQGKLKTHKCKQCGNEAYTKAEFWEHHRTHIRPEKMLTCPQCPFVTEFKHHLEYHLRNHFRSKPFQCNRCNYSCVNKSMLNSHLKSHSNVYQYRCADCNYATKYCHSLKLHLRKYDHKPSMVLNPDGTPNPLPIIDVYGTRRGPKVKRNELGVITSSVDTPTDVKDKPKNSKGANNKRYNKSQAHSVQSSNICTTPPISPESVATNIKQDYESYINTGTPVSINGASVISRPEILPTIPCSQVSQPVPISFAGNGINNIMYQNSSKMTLNPAAVALQGILLQNAVNYVHVDLVGKSPMQLYADAINRYISGSPQVVPAVNQEFPKLVDASQSKLPPACNKFQPNKPERPNYNQVKVTPEDSEISLNAPLDLRNTKEQNGCAQGTDDMKKRKRKGKAFRYDRTKEMKFDNVDESNEALDFSSNGENGRHYQSVKSPAQPVSSDEGKTTMCKYCDISFPPILYALHMRFHSGDSDPFRCNVCGVKSSDKVGFFVHLATASH